MKKYTKLFYEITMSVLALTTVGITLLDLSGRITPNSNLLLVDQSILLIFSLDYGIRLYQASDKKIFFKSNLLDLIAIIPFSSFFRLFRLARLLRILRLTKVFRMMVFLKKFQKLTHKFVKTNGFIYTLYITAGTILMGTIAIYFIERGKTIDSFLDALWWSFVTTTTVGYGDISPSTGLGRLVAVILMMVGIGFIGMLTGTIATYFIAPSKDPILHVRNKFVDLSDLSDDDFVVILKIIDVYRKK